MIKRTTHTGNKTNQNFAEAEKKNKSEIGNTTSIHAKPTEQKKKDEQCVTKSDKKSGCSS